jgi:hypothetical protein
MNRKLVIVSLACTLCTLTTLAGFIVGMEFWAQSFTDTYIDDTKINHYGENHPICDNGDKFDYFVGCGTLKVYPEQNLNCKHVCGYNYPDSPKAYMCFILSLNANGTMVRKFMNDCYSNVNVEEISTIAPANNHVDWLFVYIIGGIYLGVQIMAILICVFGKHN